MPSGGFPRHRATFATLLAIIAFVIGHARPAQATIDVWVDPGHGNYDSGTVGIDGSSPPNEANLTQPTAQWLLDWLQSFGYSAALTRNTEGNPVLWLKPRDCTRILNGATQNDLGFRDSARIIISIHMDAACNKKGVCDSTIHKTTLYWNPSSGPRYTYNFAQSLALATTLHPYVKSQADIAFQPCRGDGGVLIGNFFMIRDVRAPAALVEVCKLTNRCQFNLIQNDGVRSQMAYAIATGVTFYMNPGGAPHDPQIATPDGLAAAIERARKLGTPVEALPIPARIKTRSSVAAVSFQEGFDAATFPPPSWALITSGAPAPHNWHRTIDPLIVQSGAGAAIVSGQYTSPSDEWLVSPLVKVGPSDHGLSFYWSGNSALAGGANATCQIRRKGEVSWTQAWSLSAEPPASAFVYRDRSIDLTPFAGDSIQFAFRVQGTFGPDFAVDDVAVGDFLPTGPPANDQCAGAAELPAGFFDLSGVTCYGSNDLSPAFTTLDCLPDEMDGRDVIYRLNALAGDTLSVGVTGDWNPGLYLTNSCTTTPSCLAGQYPIDPGTSPAAFDYFFSTPGTYYLVVDGPAGECGPFTLSGRFRGPVTAVEPGTPGFGLQFAARPNPAHASIVFSGSLSAQRGAIARITIADLSGRRIASMNAPVSNGTFVVSWDARGARVPAGVYFATLEAGVIVARTAVVLAR